MRRHAQPNIVLARIVGEPGCIRVTGLGIKYASRQLLLWIAGAANERQQEEQNQKSLHSLRSRRTNAAYF